MFEALSIICGYLKTQFENEFRFGKLTEFNCFLLFDGDKS